ncbi:MAG TPA: PAS domain-containing protein [Dongiaceae bacterium]|nr:PAS domain-containing protein [Dongiaceae bacterium]
MTRPDAVTEITLAQVTSPAVKLFDQYWRSKRRDGALPQRQDIDPSEFPKLLPLFVLTDIEQVPFRIRYRLCGSHIAQQDEELTGKYLDELHNTSAEEKAGLAAHYRIACIEHRPVFARVTMRSRETGLELMCEGGIWPLSSDGQTVDKCAAIQDVARLP